MLYRSNCKGRMKLLALVIDDRSVARYLKKIGEPTDLPARAPPRGPPYWSSTVAPTQDARRPRHDDERSLR